MSEVSSKECRFLNESVEERVFKNSKQRMNVEIESQLSGRKIELKVKVTGVPEYLGVRPARLRRLCSISGIRWNRLFLFGKNSALLKYVYHILLNVYSTFYGLVYKHYLYTSKYYA